MNLSKLARELYPSYFKRVPIIEEGGEYRIRDKYHQFRLATKGNRDRPY